MEWVTANRTEPKGQPTVPRVDAPSIVAALEGELRRLQTDYVDLLQVCGAIFGLFCVVLVLLLVAGSRHLHCCITCIQTEH